MKISTKGRYALRIKIDLAQQKQGEYVRLKDVAARQGITIKYMEQIMPLLTKSGYVKSYRGNNGGYMLAKKPEEYVVGDILRVAEGSLAPIPCLEDEQNTCPRKDECKSLNFWMELQQVIDEYTNSKRLSDLI